MQSIDQNASILYLTHPISKALIALSSDLSSVLICNNNVFYDYWCSVISSDIIYSLLFNLTMKKLKINWNASLYSGI